MKKIRVGVIGAGNMAGSHVRRFREVPGVEVAACCDVAPKVLKAFARTHDIPKRYADYRALLEAEDLDAVSVATSDKAHCEISVAALRKGLHVFCEKPMATSVTEARRMVRAAKAAKKVTMIDFTYREMPALHRARELIAEGVLGRIVHVEASYLQCWIPHAAWGDWRERAAFQWRLSREHGGGALADIGCHIIDFVEYAAGGISQVSCRMKNFTKGVRGNTWKGFKLDADDSFAATVEFACGAVGVIHCTRWATGHQNALRMRIFGDKGAVVVDTDLGPDKLNVCVDSFHAHHAIWDTIETRIPAETMYSRFIRGVRSGKAEAPTFEDGLTNQRCLEAFGKSSREGKPVTLKT